jgi:hypothetical protein
MTIFSLFFSQYTSTMKLYFFRANIRSSQISARSNKASPVSYSVYEPSQILSVTRYVSDPSSRILF